MPQDDYQDILQRLKALEDRKGVGMDDLPWGPLQQRLEENLTAIPGGLVGTPQIVDGSVGYSQLAHPVYFSLGNLYGDAQIVPSTAGTYQFTETHNLNFGARNYVVVGALQDGWEVNPTYFGPGAFYCTFSIRHRDSNYFTWALNVPATAGRIAVQLAYYIIPV